MKHIKLHTTLLISSFVLFFSCATSQGNNTNTENYNDKNDPFRKVVFQEITSIDELKGTWNFEGKTLTYPFTVDGQEYLLVKEPVTNDDNLWQRYAYIHQISLTDLWTKRFAVISDIYGKESPVADENGTQAGYKLKRNSITSDYVGSFESHYEYLIPEDILIKNLMFFTKSKDGNYLKLSGTFRFFSSKFKNISVERDIYTNASFTGDVKK